MHLVAGVMPFETLKKIDVFYTLTGKSAETDTSEGVRVETQAPFIKCSEDEIKHESKNSSLSLLCLLFGRSWII